MRIIFVGLLLFCSILAIHAQPGETYFLSDPGLTPDGQTVIFSFEGDLWKADVATGNASRLTAMQGYETTPRVSPDGKWIAFTGTQYGNKDVYVMPVAGGEIRQLTFHSSDDEVCSWAWDSEDIYFQSSRRSRLSGYKLSRNGGNATKLFADDFFLYDHNLVQHPITGEIFFNDTWESASQVQRKRYTGPFNPDIQSYNVASHTYKKYTDWKGKDFGATIDEKGHVYFISDEANGEYNLYKLDGNKKSALTNFKASIKKPQVNAKGGSIVFEKEYQLWLYDVATAKSRKLNIHLLRNSVLPGAQDYNVQGNITSFDVSPDGKKLAFISRGELFVSDVAGKFIQQVEKGSGERAVQVKWLADSRTLLFNQTKDGYLNWYSIGANGGEPLKQLTNDKQDNRALSFNKNKTMAVYLSGRNEVRLLNMKTLKSETIVKDEIWGLNDRSPTFSPGDRYIAFTVFRSFEEDIMLYEMATKKTINITNTGVTETDPAWSSDGRYIYFTSSRLKPAYPFGLQDAHIYQLPLENRDTSFRMDKINDLFKEEKKDTSKKKNFNADSAVVHLNTRRIMDRLVLISPIFGTQQLAGVFSKGEKTSVFYVSNHADGKRALWKTTLEPFEKNNTEKVTDLGNNDGVDLVAVDDKLYLLSKGNIALVKTETNKTEPVSISYTFRRNLQQEFRQMFEEAWAQMEINYYDENFHGVDWSAIKKKYEPYVAQLNNRADFRVLLNDMLGELNSSHQGFRSAGSEEKVMLNNVTMETGIIFENDQPYKVRYVVAGSAADYDGIDIKPGDILKMVNHVAVDEKTDRDFYFGQPSADKEMTLSFLRGSNTIEVKIHPGTSLLGLLYDEWIDKNQARVDAKSNNRIAYACMKDMGVPELEKFVIDMTKELNGKEALILDLRYNTGGNVHDEVLKFLQQRSYLKWKYREGALTQQGNFTPADKPIVLLINEQSLSDAEMTAQGFKALKLGKIIGNETYHWIIFTSGTTLVDGSLVRLPSWGCYTLDGKDLEVTGVQPDIKVINTFEDKINGRDPQLDRAVDEILKDIGKK